MGFELWVALLFFLPRSKSKPLSHSRKCTDEVDGQRAIGRCVLCFSRLWLMGYVMASLVRTLLEQNNFFTFLYPLFDVF